MGWPQILMVVLMSSDVLITLVKHGDQKTGTYNFWSSLIVDAFFVWIMYKGGFFN